ncbi:MAG: RIFT barrel domain-containing protein [Telluria sp.]
MLIALMSLATLTACGGGGSSSTSTPLASNTPPVVSAPVETTPPATPGDNVGSDSGESEAKRNGGMLTPTPAAPVVAGTTITDVKFESTGAATQAGVPVTFGQVFVQGAVPSTQSLIGKLGDNTVVPLQVDVKARHADGSVRHAVISAVLSQVTAGTPVTMNLVTQAPYANNTAATPAAVLGAGFTANTTLTVNGTAYTVSADTLLKNGKFTNWLSGPIVNEWHVTAPLTTAGGVAHPHLTARFAIRSYTGSKKTRVDVTVENAWAYEAAPQNILYDAKVTVGGATVYEKAGLNHYHHARWRKMFWWGGEPMVHIKHNTPYLIKTRVVPNYDQSIVFPESILDAMKTQFSGARVEPMANGAAMAGMGTAGGRPDIGVLPGWAVTYLLTQDKRAKDVTNGTADLSGSWSIHYRDKKNDRPVSIIDYPYMTLLGQRNDTLNPATKQLEAFPLCATTTACTSPLTSDTSHQPMFAMLPYIVTGDYFYLEELQFWTMYSMFESNPWYRSYATGLVKHDQARGQAWTLRTLAMAAFISPDSDPLKAQFATFLSNNLDWYNANYTNNASANKLGILIDGAFGYDLGRSMAPWMDDFFTQSLGYITELGFTKAAPLLAWKAKFPIDRMIGEGACWIDGAQYTLRVRDSDTGPFYTTIKQAYLASHTAEFGQLACGSQAMATALGVKVGEMAGYSEYEAGYPSNLQPALAYAAGISADGAKAWSVFNNRSVKPDYSRGPQFAIVPR